MNVSLTTMTRLSTLLGIAALTLIALPVSVLAQQETVTASPTQTEDEVATTTEVVAQTVSANRYSDRYSREELPKSNRVFNDFVVGPGRFTLEIAPGESKTVMLNISNRLGDERLFRLTTEDIAAGEGEDEGNITLLGEEVGPYTLKDYISFSDEEFYIKNGERAVVPVTISLPPDAEPGGFYGSILTEVLPKKTAGEQTEVAPTTPLVTRIGTLFYITTPGDIQREGALVDFSTIPDKSFYLQGPIDMGLVYENTGSVHLTPYGKVTVKNILGDIVGQVELDPWYVMPKSVRTREISWDREFLLGRYVVTADIEHGYGDEFDTATLIFWVFPWKFLAMVFGGVFFFFFILRFIIRNFEFKRKK